MTCAIVGCDNAEFGEHEICEDCLSVYVRLRDAGTVDNWREFNHLHSRHVHRPHSAQRRYATAPHAQRPHGASRLLHPMGGSLGRFPLTPRFRPVQARGRSDGQPPEGGATRPGQSERAGWLHAAERLAGLKAASRWDVPSTTRLQMSGSVPKLARAATRLPLAPDLPCPSVVVVPKRPPPSTRPTPAAPFGAYGSNHVQGADPRLTRTCEAR
jgi:hypothetical protein